MQTLYLRKNEERRLLAGHLWVFGNEVDVARSRFKEFEPGEQARIVSASGRPLGSGYVNPHSLISVRMVSREGKALDRDLLTRRIARALELRESLFKSPYYRLVFSEGDYLPGLVVDRYGDILVVQLTTAGMEQKKDVVVRALEELTKPKGILFRNDGSVRSLEGLESYVEMVGSVPEEAVVEENGLRFTVPLAGGQKTGWFFDQRVNRAAFATYAGKGRVLDAFSYVGGFGVTAAVTGAQEVVCLDSSGTALEYVQKNAEMNGVGDRVRTEVGDAFDMLRQLGDRGERFGAVSLDPPALIKRGKDHAAGLAGYRKLNKLALALVEDGGVLTTCSCSRHLGAEELRGVLQRVATEAGARLQIVERGRQGPDHPVHPAMPETEYLKTITVRVVR
jgi:23S rRNA (cytosine1962-C5)-methyltransferase